MRNETSHEHRLPVSAIDIVSPSIVVESELTDFDADQRLLAMSGVSLVIFTSVGCSSCRYARECCPGSRWRSIACAGLMPAITVGW
jgi:hypothetical protein